MCTGAAGSRFWSSSWWNLALMAVVLVLVQVAMQSSSGDDMFNTKGDAVGVS